MSKTSPEFQAWLWNGRQQIPGRLRLLEKKLRFELTSFPSSHLQLEILYEGITGAEEFLVFDLARNGLRIQSMDGRSDLFVLDDILVFKEALQDRLGKK
jgi:hypothetical protein